MTLQINPLQKKECSMENLDSLIDLIWSRKDTLLVAIGSNSCIRAVYLKSIELKKNNQFSYCEISKINYSLGKAEEKLKSKLIELIKRNEKYKIFVYMSCMDIVTAIDIEKIIDEVKEIYDEAEIFFIKRGPMVKRCMTPKENLIKILKNFDLKEEKKNKYYELPFFAGEIEILMNSLYYTEHKKCLIQAGGCTSCLKRSGMQIDDSVYTTSFNDLDLTFGLEQNLIQECEKSFDGKDNIIFLETLLPQITGFNKEIVENTLFENGINNSFLSLDENKEIFNLLKEAYKVVIKDILSKNMKKSDDTLICGYSSLLDCQKINLWEEIEKLADKKKYILKFDNYLPERLLIVSMEGFVFMKAYREFIDISYSIFFPTKINFDISIIDKKKKIIILGDPIQIKGYERILRNKFQDIKIILGFFYPDIILDTEIEKFLNKNEIKIYKNIEDIMKIIDRKTVLVADKEINMFISSKILYRYDFIELKCLWISSHRDFD